MSEQNEEYIAAARRLARQAQSAGVRAGEVVFDWDQDQIEADIYAALTAAHRAGKLEGLREAASICDPMAYDSGGNIRKQIAARIAEIDSPAAPKAPSAEGWRDPDPHEECTARVYLFDDINGVVIGGRKHGWLVWRHPDGQWVTVQKADVRDPLECVPDVLAPAPPKKGE